MTVISLKDYAKQNNISYEAVRQQVVRYKDDLGSHIIRDGRQQFLDEEAVAFLDARRQKNPVAIIQMDKDEKIEQLEQENKLLLRQLATVQDALLKEKEQKELLLTEQRGQISRLEADNEAARAKVAEAEKTAQEAQKGLVRAQEAFEEDLRKKNKQIQILENYAAEVAAYNALPWIRRIGKKAPAMPEER